MSAESAATVAARNRDLQRQKMDKVISYKLDFDKLTNDPSSYPAWATRAEDVLMGLGLDSLLSDGVTEHELQLYSTAFLVLLRRMVSNELLPQLMAITNPGGLTPRMAWDKLRAPWVADCIAIMHITETEFHNFTWSESTPIVELVTQLQSLRLKYVTAGGVMSDGMLISHLFRVIGNVTSEYDTVIMLCREQPAILLSVQAVQGRLQTHERTLIQRRRAHAPAAAGEVAMLVQPPPPPLPPQRPPPDTERIAEIAAVVAMMMGDRRGGGRGGGRRVYYNGGGRGGGRGQDRNSQQRQRADFTCYRCGGRNHRAAECPTPDDGRGGT